MNGPNLSVLPGIFQAKYKEKSSNDQGEILVWNTLEIKNFFAQLEPSYDVDLYLKELGWTYDEYWFNVE